MTDSGGQSGGTLYAAAAGFEQLLQEELAQGGPVRELGPGVYFQEAPAIPAAWAAQIGMDARVVPFASIGEAAKNLKALVPVWTLVPGEQYRRSVLIAEKMRKRRERTWVFGDGKRPVPAGMFTLLDRDHLIAAPTSNRPFAGGALRFQEDHSGPPSRAYRKLWEALLLLDAYPQAGDYCMDCGAAPGAWTWSLAKLGCRVTAVDKAPLDDAVLAIEGVDQIQGSAFAVDPATPVDWFFSDVICYPKRLLTLIERWERLGTCKKFVITVKLQGETDREAVETFKNLPNSVLLHLHHNKHELTWIRHPQLRGWHPRGWPWFQSGLIPD